MIALLTPEEFLALPNPEGHILEYDDGHVVECAMSLSHNIIQAWLTRSTGRWIDSSASEVYVLSCAGFWLNRSQLRKPDVSIVRRSVLDAMELHRGDPLGAPDIAIEVISDTDQTADIERKTELYLDSGTAIVWNIFPQSKTVLQRRKGARPVLLADDDHLEAPDLFPGLRIPVGEIFR